MIENRLAAIEADHFDQWTNCSGSINEIDSIPCGTLASAGAYAAGRELAAMRLRCELDDDLAPYNSTISRLRASKIRSVQAIDSAAAAFSFLVLSHIEENNRLRVFEKISLPDWAGSIELIADALLINESDNSAEMFSISMDRRPKLAANDCTRLKLLAFGLIDKADIRKISLTICQPLVSHSDTVVVSDQEMRIWAKEIYRPALDSLQEAPRKLSTGFWCKKCPAKGTCMKTQKGE